VAVTVAVLILTIMMIFSGFLIKLDSIFNWLSWIQWISAIRYASNVVMINEFRGLTFCLANASEVCLTSGENVLKDKAIDHTVDWDLWKYFLALSLMVVIFFVLTYIQLIRIKKTK
jgi:hypothetical protein